jgi:hypothetical protein
MANRTITKTKEQPWRRQLVDEDVAAATLRPAPQSLHNTQISRAVFPAQLPYHKLGHKIRSDLDHLDRFVDAPPGGPRAGGGLTGGTLSTHILGARSAGYP